jgi:hypothetical protein
MLMCDGQYIVSFIGFDSLEQITLMVLEINFDPCAMRMENDTSKRE